MSRFLETFDAWVITLLVLTALMLGLSAVHFRQQAEDRAEQLTAVQAQVAQQNDEAARQLADLTHQRDARQAQLEALYRSQEEQDAFAQSEIARLESELAARPVRVRVVARACGAGGGGAAGGAAAGADAGAADFAEADGLLPEPNARRLGAVMAEMEMINAAYASCRSQLLALHAGAGDE